MASAGLDIFFLPPLVKFTPPKILHNTSGRVVDLGEDGPNSVPNHKKKNSLGDPKFLKSFPPNPQTCF